MVTEVWTHSTQQLQPTYNCQFQFCGNLCYRDMHIVALQETQALPRAGQGIGSRQRQPFAESHVRYSAKPSLSSAKLRLLDNEAKPSATHSAKAGARQSSYPSSAGCCCPLCRVPAVWHSAKAGSLPSASCPGTR